MKPGFYQMSNDEYHAEEGASKSTLHTLLTYSPAHAITPREETPALYDGQAIHCAVFEPDRYGKEYVVKPEGMSFATKEGKSWRDLNSDKKIITFDNNQNFQAMAQAVRAHPIAKELISDGEPELSGFWNDPDKPDLLCKLRLDWINKGNMIISDLKSCTDAREHVFTRDSYNYGYDMQAGWYLYGVTQITRIEHHDFRFIAVEKKAPFGVMVYKASQEFINHGLLRCSRALEIYYECLKSEVWPNYPQDLKDLNLPGWVMRKPETTTIFE